MHLKQVETVLTVAECGSFSRAGEKLFISSSAVAQQIGSLEEDIGASLFHRTTHGVRLTEIGRYLAAEGRELVERSLELVAEQGPSVVGDIMVAHDRVKWQLPIIPCSSKIPCIAFYPFIIIHSIFSFVVFINERFKVFISP